MICSLAIEKRARGYSSGAIVQIEFARPASANRLQARGLDPGRNQHWALTLCRRRNLFVRVEAFDQVIQGKDPGAKNQDECRGEQKRQGSRLEKLIGIVEEQ